MAILDIRRSLKALRTAAASLRGSFRLDKGTQLSHPLLVAAIENSANGIVVTDSAGDILWVNPAFSELTGYYRAEIVGKNTRILKSGSHPPEFYAELWQTVLANRPWSGQMRNRRKDGSEYMEEMTITPMCGRTGAVSHFIAIKQDITRRYEAEQELRASRERLELGLDVSGQGLWDWNLVSGEAFLTAGFRRLLGYGDDEAQAGHRGGFGLIHPDDRAVAEELLLAHLGGRSQKYEAEVRLQKKNGEYLRVLSRGKVVSRDDSGRPLRIVGIYSDVSDRAKLQQQLQQAQKLEAVGLLAGGLARDLNNLLTVINGYTDMLLPGRLPPDQARECLGMIRDSGERAATLVRRLLSFSRSHAQEPRIFDLNDVVIGLRRLLQRFLPGSIELTCTLEPRLGLVLADPGLIQEVLINLVVNARDAMPQGGRLEIETTNPKLNPALSQRHLDMPHGSYVVLTIADTGAGMDEVIEKRLSEPFSTTRPPGLGTGVDLSTVYGIVKHSGGSISIYSEKGKGTRVHVYLPCVEDEGAQADVPRRVAPEGGDATVLLVEDSTGVRQFTGTVLQSLGYKVLEAAGGKEAVAVSRNSPAQIDLLITDVVLPDSSGQDIARQLTAIWPGLAVLYISGYPLEGAVQEGMPQAEVEFLQKPFTGEVLGLRVRQILQKSKRPPRLPGG